jgi:DUF1009 family protein
MGSGVLGIVAGGGDLPRAVADSAQAAGRALFVLALRGLADDWVSRHAHQWVSLGEAGKALKALRDAGCEDVLLVGRVARPKFSEIQLDAKSILLAPRVFAAALKGDDALLRSLVDIFEREGFRAVGVADAAPGLVAGEGAIGKYSPTGEHETDIAAGLRIVSSLGALDVGQAAIVCAGLTLAVEAAEGTDAMIGRISLLPEHIRGTRENPRGVLVKAAKPIQDRKTDLPVIGVTTVANAAAVGLAGIAVEAGSALIVDKEAVRAAADAAKFFVVGVRSPG